MIYLALFWSFFQVGLFSIGGGLASLPLIQHQVVNLHHWLTIKDFTDLITISQMTPGPIAINASTFVGLQIAGLGGAIIATIGCIVPSCIIVLFLAYLYYKYKNMSITKNILDAIRPSVVSLIAAAGISILITAFWGEQGFSGISKTDFVSVGIFLASLFTIRKFKISPMYVMSGAGVIGLIIYYVIL